MLKSRYKVLCSMTHSGLTMMDNYSNYCYVFSFMYRAIQKVCGRTELEGKFILVQKIF